MLLPELLSMIALFFLCIEYRYDEAMTIKIRDPVTRLTFGVPLQYNIIDTT